MKRVQQAVFALVSLAATSIAAQPRRAPTAASTRCPDVTGTATTTQIRGGNVWSPNGAISPHGTLTMRGSAIAVDGNGASVVEVPESAWITPAFVSTMTPIGLVEIELEDSTNDSSYASAPAIHPALFAADAFNPRSELNPVARLGGIGSVLSVPMQGMVSGTSAVITLGNVSFRELVLNARAAVHADVDDGGIAAAGGARTVAFTRLRELLLDTRTYVSQRAAYDRGELRELSVPRAELEAMAPVLAGAMPLVVTVSRAVDIQRVLSLASEFSLRLVLDGAEEAWLVADELAHAHATVIIDAQSNLPTRFSALSTTLENAARLSARGVSVVLKVPGAWNVNGLRHSAGLAVANGMDRNLALRAITELPLRTFGVQNTGTFDVGQCADVAVWSGDPFETTTYLTHLWIHGSPIPLRSRQTELFERYRTLPPRRIPAQ